MALFIVDDFIYYVFHRFAHRVNIGWAAHVVHHSSEYYNLSTALRQSIFQGLLSMWFYLPLAFFGVPLAWILATHSLNLVYQYWIHSSSVNKLPYLLELFMNTPSHHRVHHGRNPKYLDKNYAGVFIIWDRLLGTFQLELEKPVYGIVKPLSTYNPVYIQTHYFRDLWSEFKQASTTQDKLLIWFKEPGWRPRNLKPFDEPQQPENNTKKSLQYTYNKTNKNYIILSFVTIQLSFIVVALWENASALLLSFANLSLLTSFILLGYFIDKTKTAYQNRLP